MKIIDSNLNLGKIIAIALDRDVRLENLTEWSSKRFGTVIRFTIKLLSKKRWQAKRRSSNNGWRKVNAVCWHGQTGFLDEVFLAYPDVRLDVRIHIQGATEWFAQRAESGLRNIGSQAQPLRWMDGCDCGERCMRCHVQTPTTFGWCGPCMDQIKEMGYEVRDQE